jgi:glycosyltransferase involved in cell wall biosynthesis
MRLAILSLATHMVGCSQAACESLFGQSHYSRKRTRVLPNAIDLEAFRSRQIPKPAARTRLGLPGSGLIVGHVGRFDRQKNHAGLIRIVAELLSAEPSSQLLLVGDGPLRKTIEEQCRLWKLSSRVHFLGVRTDVAEILSALDCFVFPSLYEGLGLALIEAQAVGLPCVVSDAVPREADVGLGLIRRVGLQENGQTWAGCILEASAQDRPDFFQRKLAFESAGYDIGSSFGEWEQLYRREARIEPCWKR